MRYNVLKSRAARLCRALRRLTHMCSSNLSDAANMSGHGSTLCSPTVEKLLCRSLFSQRSHVGNLRQTLKGKGRFTRGWKPQVSTLLCPRRVGALPAEVQRKHPARQGRTRSRSSRAPVSRCRETGCRPAGTYESLRLNSSYPNIRTTSSVPSARRMAISGSGIPLNVLVLTMV